MWKIVRGPFVQKSCNPFTRVSNFDRKDTRGKTHRCTKDCQVFDIKSCVSVSKTFNFVLRLQKYIDDFEISDRFGRKGTRCYAKHCQFWLWKLCYYFKNFQPCFETVERCIYDFETLDIWEKHAKDNQFWHKKLHWFSASF